MKIDYSVQYYYVDPHNNIYRRYKFGKDYYIYSENKRGWYYAGRDNKHILKQIKEKQLIAYML